MKIVTKLINTLNSLRGICIQESVHRAHSRYIRTVLSLTPHPLIISGVELPEYGDHKRVDTYGEAPRGLTPTLILIHGVRPTWWSTEGLAMAKGREAPVPVAEIAYP